MGGVAPITKRAAQALNRHPRRTNTASGGQAWSRDARRRSSGQGHRRRELRCLTVTGKTAREQRGWSGSRVTFSAFGRGSPAQSETGGVTLMKWLGDRIMGYPTVHACHIVCRAHCPNRSWNWVATTLIADVWIIYFCITKCKLEAVLTVKRQYLVGHFITEEWGLGSFRGKTPAFSSVNGVWM